MALEVKTAALRNGRPGDRFDVLAGSSTSMKGSTNHMDPPDPVDAIKFRMARDGRTRRDLEAIIGTHTRIAKVLNGKRRLSIGMIFRRHERSGSPTKY